MSDLSEQLLSRADTIFGKIAEAAGSASAFAMEQLPDIAQQFIAYNRAYYTFIIILSIIGALSLLKVGKILSDSLEDDFPARFIPALIYTLIVGVVSPISFFVCMKGFFMVWFAPKVFLITEIIHLAK